MIMTLQTYPRLNHVYSVSSHQLSNSQYIYLALISGLLHQVVEGDECSSPTNTSTEINISFYYTDILSTNTSTEINISFYYTDILSTNTSTKINISFYYTDILLTNTSTEINISFYYTDILSTNTSTEINISFYYTDILSTNTSTEINISFYYTDILSTNTSTEINISFVITLPCCEAMRTCSEIELERCCLGCRCGSCAGTPAGWWGTLGRRGPTTWWSETASQSGWPNPGTQNTSERCNTLAGWKKC